MPSRIAVSSVTLYFTDYLVFRFSCSGRLWIKTGSFLLVFRQYLHIFWSCIAGLRFLPTICFNQNGGVRLEPGSRLPVRFELFLMANSASQLVTTDHLYAWSTRTGLCQVKPTSREASDQPLPQKTPGPLSAISISSGVRQMSL